MRPIKIIFFVLLLGIGLQCCVPVKPWEKEFLAKSSMQLDPDGLEARFKQHTYQSKEGSSGGYGVGGGGCGCN